MLSVTSVIKLCYMTKNKTKKPKFQYVTKVANQLDLKQEIILDYLGELFKEEENSEKEISEMW